MRRPPDPHTTSGFREVKPNRRRQKDTPSRRRRQTIRALRRAVATAECIHATADERAHARAAGEANTNARLTTDLNVLYGDLRADRRAIYAIGLVPEGAPFHRGQPQEAR